MKVMDDFHIVKNQRSQHSYLIYLSIFITVNQSSYETVSTLSVQEACYSLLVLLHLTEHFFPVSLIGKPHLPDL